MNVGEKDTYFVAVKVFLEKDGRLLILKDNFGDWDLPGGRIKVDEFDIPLERVISRKMSEELGDGIQYSIGRPVVFMRHERVEQAPGNPLVRIFAIGYEGKLEGGGIRLSRRHPEMLWVDIKDFKPENYFKGGWLKGVQEFLSIKRRERKFPRGVEIVSSAIIQKDGKILLTKSPKWSNKWTLPGGHIEAGEPILEAAKREAEEETSLKLKPIGILTFGELINSKDFHRPSHFIYFDCIFDVVGGELRLQMDELTESKWLTPQEALKLELAESYPETLQKYIDFLNESKI